MDSIIRGYHQYKTIRENPSHSDELLWKRQIGNTNDTHTMAIKKDIEGVQTIMGHITKKVYSLCSNF